ncbi:MULTISPECIES: Gfo/Idh/MocA family protein [Micromonospora]|uniref:Gfo/Idh/MocA family protein n=1 Tax=Micromonospora TaxID=1873 RepID=UPI0021A2FE6D|nr:Gfo/Idh/MocA family oxidoreductase [Micromonospora chalcea]MCT2279575.1 Gfo/Idh/MocA family oxidoreductase [Micromonospora chalcea]
MRPAVVRSGGSGTTREPAGGVAVGRAADQRIGLAAIQPRAVEPDSHPGGRHWAPNVGPGLARTRAHDLSRRRKGGIVSVTIGLVGAGRQAARVHAPALAGSPAVRFAGVWARTPGPVHEIADRHHVRPFDHFAELLDHCDAVAFAVPPRVQAELAAVAAQRGKSVFLERPMAGDIAGAEELVEAVQRTRVTSQLALAWRYSTEVRRFLHSEVKRIRPNGGAGRLISAMVCSPAVCNLSRWACRAADSFGARPFSLPLALAMAMPSRVRMRSRSTSNSAKVARMLKNILPIGSVGS